MNVSPLENPESWENQESVQDCPCSADGVVHEYAIYQVFNCSPEQAWLFCGYDLILKGLPCPMSMSVTIQWYNSIGAWCQCSASSLFQDPVIHNSIQLRFGSKLYMHCTFHLVKWLLQHASRCMSHSMHTHLKTFMMINSSSTGTYCTVWPHYLYLYYIIKELLKNKNNTNYFKIYPLGFATPLCWFVMAECATPWDVIISVQRDDWIKALPATENLARTRTDHTSTLTRVTF